jgi:hypothetical protein
MWHTQKNRNHSRPTHAFPLNFFIVEQVNNLRGIFHEACTAFLLLGALTASNSPRVVIVVTPYSSIRRGRYPQLKRVALATLEHPAGKFLGVSLMNFVDE